ncbi:MAG: hypothetical protein C5B59_14340 [Bacteroidetes bacterium]|nr:MAG: hypothetical protein C5B59_14340 [Bacteroidota bacterium]
MGELFLKENSKEVKAFNFRQTLPESKTSNQEPVSHKSSFFWSIYTQVKKSGCRQMIKFEWFETLTESQAETLKQFYYSLPLIHVEQYPGWNNLGGDGESVKYCVAAEDGKLKGYVIVREYKKIEAKIILGPLCKNADDTIGIVLEVIRYYKKKNYLSLLVLLGMSVGTDATYIQYSLFKKHRFSWHFDKLNKGTLLLKLSDRGEEEIVRSFSEGHRRAIKKGLVNNFTCRVLQCPCEIDQFANGYFEMLDRRTLSSSLERCKRKMSSIYDWLQKEKKGFFLGLFENEKMLGGLLVLFRGEMAECYCGFSLRDDRKLRINHVTVYEAMKLVKQLGIPYFDLGGYFILVDEDDQVYHINQFKKGFHGEYFFYPPIMYFDLKPFGTSIIRFLKYAKGKITYRKRISP